MKHVRGSSYALLKMCFFILADSDNVVFTMDGNMKVTHTEDLFLWRPFMLSVWEIQIPRLG